MCPGNYVKSAPVWAEKSDGPGSIAANEGESHYLEGDFLVYNNADGSDAYCVAAEKFDAMYELDD